MALRTSVVVDSVVETLVVVCGGSVSVSRGSVVVSRGRVRVSRGRVLTTVVEVVETIVSRGNVVVETRVVDIRDVETDVWMLTDVEI